MANVPATFTDWSATASANQPDTGDSSSGMRGDLQQIQATVRAHVGGADTITAASTTELGSKESRNLTVNGTTGISSFGSTLTATGYGISYDLTFAGALTITHSSSLVCPGSANITTEAGDTCRVVYSSTGWTITQYNRKTWAPPSQSGNSGKFLTTNGSVLSWGAAAVSLSGMTAATATNTLANGVYAQTWGWSGNAGSTTLFTWDFDITGGSSPTGMLLDFSGCSGAASGIIGFHIKGASYSTINLLAQVTNPGYYSSGGFLRIANDGTVYLGGASTCTGAGGFAGGTDVIITGNDAYATGAYDGGDVTIAGGAAGNSGTGGSVAINAGQRTGAGGVYGTVTLTSNTVAARARLDGATGITLDGSGKLVLDMKHIYVDNSNGAMGASDVTSGGGSGVDCSGSDHAFQITAGTGASSTIVVTFKNAYASAPMAVVSASESGLIAGVSCSTTQATFVFSPSAPSSGTKINCVVYGLQ